MDKDISSELSWEDRYHQADAQLQKFRSQAGKVRELLGLKVFILTSLIKFYVFLPGYISIIYATSSL